MVDMAILHYLSVPQSHLLLISLVFIITWVYTLHPKWSFCIDDIEGVAKFSDRFVQRKDDKGNIISEEKVDYYEEDVAGKKVRHGNFALNTSIGFPGCLMRWFRCMWGRKFKEIGRNSKGHPIYGFVQVAWKHHLLSLIVQYSNSVLAYLFLSKLFTPQLALVSTLIFITHPISVQVTAWISGVNYGLSMLGTLVALNMAFLNLSPYLLIPTISIPAIFSSLTLLPGSLTWVPLLFLGRFEPAIIYFISGMAVFAYQAYVVVSFRKKSFKEQQMVKPTEIYVRRFFVVIKTIWYYLKMIVFPKRLGLFHTFGYHFEDPINYADRSFWLGIVSLVALSFLAYFSEFPVRFGIVWFFVYLTVFMNFVTAMQFVSERYVYFPSLGFALVLGYFIQDYPIILAFLLGIYVMRVWVHLPSFQNEVRFYESNVFNFPDSEVAMGNLGVSYLNHGMAHKAFDTWQEATRQNPLYDVPWYNLYSIYKQNGDIINARKALAKCLNSTVIHFPEQWTKELAELDAIIAQAVSDGRIKQVPI